MMGLGAVEAATATTTSGAALGAEVHASSFVTPATAYTTHSAHAAAAPLLQDVDIDDDNDHQQQQQQQQTLGGVQDLYYQTSYRVEQVGKYQKSTKRRVTWTFCKRTASASSANGTNSNNEHDISFEVVLIWSLRTGKQRILVNGVEEYFCKRKGASLVEHEWELLPPDDADATCCGASLPEHTDTATETATNYTSSSADPTTSSFISNSNNNKNITTGSNSNNGSGNNTSMLTPPWLILHLVAARVKPINTEPSFVLDELLLNNVRFSQLPNQAGEIVHSNSSTDNNATVVDAKDPSTYGVQTLVTLSSAFTPNENDNDATTTRPPLSILDILYPQGIGPEVFPASSSSAAHHSKVSSPTKNNNNNATAAAALRNDFRLF